MRLGSYLKLTRPLNLLVIAYTAWVTYIVVTHVDGQGIQLHSSPPPAGLLLTALALMLMAAAGNVYNDLIDQEADARQPGKKPIVGRVISAASARNYALILSVSSLVIGTGLAIYKGYGWILPATLVLDALLLLLYSRYMQYRPVAGNALVALMLAMVPLQAVSFMDNGSLLRLVQGEQAWQWMVFLVFFAFSTNLLRELLKDVQDNEGDAAVGSGNLVQVIGVEKARHLCVGLSLCIATCLVMSPKYLPVLGQENVEPVTVALGGALTVLSALMLGGNSSRSLGIISLMLKMIMIFGVTIPLMTLL